MSRFLRICNQSFFFKSKKVSKNAEFHADFESVEKVLKKFTQKKLLAKTWRKNALFHIYSVRQTAYNFFCGIFSQLFQRIQNQRKILRFLTPLLTLKKLKILGHISTFFKL